jgi:hypothetical protein
MKKFRGLVPALVLGSACLASPALALQINPIFADSYTGQDFGIGPVISLDGNTVVTSTITKADQQLSSLFSNNVTVNILYYGAHDTTRGFLGASVSGQTTYSYAQYTDALKADSLAHPGNTNLATAVANLGVGNGASGDPASTFLTPTTPDARALGLGLGSPTSFGAQDSSPQFDSTGDFLGGGGTIDAIVFLNLDQPLSFTRPIQPVSDGVVYDALQTMEHETDEVLGIGGAGSTLNDFVADPNFAQDFFGVTGDVYGPLDLYRYLAPGAPSYIANPGFDPTQFAYFSIDGGNTLIDTFNQSAMAFGDAADWGLDLSTLCPGGGGFGGFGSVQDAFSCNNEAHNVIKGTPEYVAFQAIGYNAIPEPVTISLFGAGLAGAVAMRRRKQAT